MIPAAPVAAVEAPVTQEAVGEETLAGLLAKAGRMVGGPPRLSSTDPVAAGRVAIRAVAPDLPPGSWPPLPDAALLHRRRAQHAGLCLFFHQSLVLLLGNHGPA